MNHLCQASDMVRGTSVGILKGHRGVTCLMAHYTDPIILPVTADRWREPKEKRKKGQKGPESD